MASYKEIVESLKDDIKKIIDTLSKDTRDDRETSQYIEEYGGERTRRSKSVGKRENKTVDVYTENAETGVVTKSSTKTIITSKISIPFPKKIVRTRAHFLFGGEMTMSSDESGEGFNAFKDAWDESLKMQNVLKQLARTCMIETKAAVIFYPAPTTIDGKDALKLRSKVLNSDSGEFFPHFDDMGDMDAFIYKFKTKDIAGKAVEKATIYTEERIKTYQREGSSWELSVDIENLFRKIPVVYVEQDDPEWESVVTMIDTFENRISRLADTNDYFGEPLLKIFGEVKKFPGKEEIGKVLEFNGETDANGKFTHGDAEYATWDNSPESTKLELETAWDSIFSMTSTPDLSFNNIKGIGNVSGVAMQLMFLDAFIAREEKMEIFDPALRRCLSVVVAGIKNITAVKYSKDKSLDGINIDFTGALPDDVADMIDMLVTAAGQKPIMSQESASAMNPLVKDSDTELERIRKENGSAPNESFNA